MSTETVCQTIQISFLLPVYNVAIFLDDCIQSILHQELDIPFEIICVDDCSTDDSYEKLINLQFRNEYNKNRHIIIISNTYKDKSISRINTNHLSFVFNVFKK